MKIKVCGLTSAVQMCAAATHGADFVGMILFAGSARSVLPRLPEEEEAIASLSLSKVGVFVDEQPGFVLDWVRRLRLSVVQLHGDESPDYCAQIRTSVPVIKAFRVAAGAGLDELVAPWMDVCDAFLFDAAGPQPGGNGRFFDWELLRQAQIGKPFFLAGGIGPVDAERLSQFRHPFFHSIDINSRFETAPGVKDMTQLARFINRLKSPKAS